jgi:hypothetical protein
MAIEPLITLLTGAEVVDVIKPDCVWAPGALGVEFNACPTGVAGAAAAVPPNENPVAALGAVGEAAVVFGGTPKEGIADGAAVVVAVVTTGAELLADVPASAADVGGLGAPNENAEN